MTALNLFTLALTLLSLYGVLLNIQKKSSCFIVWTFTNFSWAVVDFAFDLFWQGILFTVYFGLAIYGLYKWRMEERNGRADKSQCSS